MNSSQHLGQYGEHLVATYIRNRGYEILAQNFRVRGAEIDIVARDGTMICFIEVKTRKNPLVDSAELISQSKQQSIRFAAACFMIRYYSDMQLGMQFDVALVDCVQGGPHITYLENAFEGRDDA